MVNAEDDEARRHLRTMLSAAGIILRCRKQGMEPEPIFYEALEEATAKAGAFLLTTEREKP